MIEIYIFRTDVISPESGLHTIQSISIIARPLKSAVRYILFR